MKKTVEINWFKIKEGVISRISEGGIYEYRFIRTFESDREYYGEVGKRKGVSIDKDNRRFVSCEELENDPVVKKIRKINFSDLPKEMQERLLSRILKEVEFRTNLLLRKDKKKFEDFIVYPYVRTEVRKFDNFYLVINISHRCVSKKNIWDLAERNPEKLRSLIGKRLVNIINPKMEKSFEIERILNPDPQKIEWIINYFIEEKGYINSVEELEKKVGRIDYNQPIIRARNGFDFIPQCSALVFNLEELPQESRRQFRKHTLIKNEDKRKKLKSIVEEFSDRLNDSPLAIEAIQLNQPKLLVRRLNNNEKEITNTNRIFSWIWKDTEEEICLPFEVPELIKGSSIPTFILIDNEVESGENVYEKVVEIFKKYNRIAGRDTRLPRFNFRRKRFVFSRKEVEKILSKIRKIKQDERFNLAFAIIVGKEKYKEYDYYEDLKRQLFQLNIISQNVLEKTLENKYAINNLLIQILSKLGVKYFALKSRSPYDYILGVDIGKHEYGHRIGGCVVIFDSEGKIKRIQPVKSLAPGETLDLPKIIEFLINRTDLELRDKNILILRDGTVKQQEKQDLVEISRKYTTKITVMGIVKTGNHIIFTDDLYNIAVSLNNFTLLLPHRTEGARPIRVDEKIEVDGEKINVTKLSGNDLQLLIDLTRLNYTSLFSDEKSLKLPAPVHYADKFVKALEKDWKIESNLLKEGFLYFI